MPPPGPGEPRVERAAGGHPFVVGLGASAGGITALREFFSHVPPETDAAYCVVLHLSPDYDSQLAQVLQLSTPLPVEQIAADTPLEVGHVYVLPPNRRLSAVDGMLRLHEASAEERRVVVDLFFQSLAETHGAACAAAVLSGTGRNGTTGLKRIKECGGLTLAQSPSDAEYPQMPESAVSTGLIDVVAPARELPARIALYGQRMRDERTHHEDPTRADSDASREVLALLRLQTGHDFSSYKIPTLLRRIRRRAHIRNVGSIGEYATLLRQSTDEAPALMKDLLISVTKFFRDPEAFVTLGQLVVPRLFRDRGPRDHVRVWVSACATGEEAYVIAILLAEEAARRPAGPSVQVFATDLDAGAITHARDGLYSEADVAELGEERRRRFFSFEAGGYRVRRELREMLLFATHNVIRDPPFSHLDLITCRNLLIYLNRTAQERVLETFHFALRPGGYLWLGQSESAENADALFTPLDKGAHLYEARAATTRMPVGRVDHSAMGVHPPLPSETMLGRIPEVDLHLRLVEQYAPPSVVIADDYRVLHLSERAGRFLVLPGGRPSQNLFALIRPELKSALRGAVLQAAQARQTVEAKAVPCRIDEAQSYVDISVRPVLHAGDPPRGLFLVTFQDDAQPAADAPAAPLAAVAESGGGALEDEIARLRADLRGTVEQYETQQEEAKAANEELQAMNEELRSTAEELETGKEELQSVNEELTTVNQELKGKINELAQTNNDFQNLIAATEIGTIFLDADLRIKFSTPSARAVFNLQESDAGRPLSDITSKLLNESLHDDVRGVLKHLSTVDREIQTREGRWQLVRIRPYRTSDGPVRGVVITFQDISERYAAELRAREGEERLRLLIDSAVDYAIFTTTLDGRIDFWNLGAQRMFGYTADEIVGRDVAVLFTPEDRAAHMPEQERARAARNGRASDQRFHLRKDGGRFYGSGVLTSLGNRGYAKIARDLSGPRDAESSVRAVQLNADRREKEGRAREVAAHVDAVRRIVAAQEGERARIARDLHDSLGQMLTALRLTLERQQAAGSPDALNPEVERAITLAKSIDRELDFLAWELRPSVLEELGLAAALPRFVQDWSAHYGIHAEYRSAFEPGQLTSDAEVAFYRIAQEALNNVAKHARATRVDVMLETRDGIVVLLVEDNGVGFDVADHDLITGRFGIVGMRERAALIGAVLDLESAAGEGTSLFLRRAMTPPSVP